MSVQEQRDQAMKWLKEAAEAESRGDFAVASLLALQVLQLEPGAAEATAVLERAQAALSAKRNGKDRPAPLGATPSLESANDSFLIQSAALPWTGEREETIPKVDLERLTPIIVPRRESLLSRVRRSAVPLIILALLVSAAWFDLHRRGEHRAAPLVANLIRPAATRPNSIAKAVPSPPAREKPASPAPPPSKPVTTPAPVPGTVALNVVPWARIESIQSVTDGRQVSRAGLVSPCTLTLPPGEYDFTVSHPDFGTLQFPVLVKSGEVNSVRHSLLSDRTLAKELASNLESMGARYEPGTSPGNRSRRSPAERGYFTQQHLPR